MSGTLKQTLLTSQGDGLGDGAPDESRHPALVAIDIVSAARELALTNFDRSRKSADVIANFTDYTYPTNSPLFIVN